MDFVLLRKILDMDKLKLLQSSGRVEYAGLVPEISETMKQIMELSYQQSKDARSVLKNYRLGGEQAYNFTSHTVLFPAADPLNDPSRTMEIQSYFAKDGKSGEIKVTKNIPDIHVKIDVWKIGKSHQKSDKPAEVSLGGYSGLLYRLEYLDTVLRKSETGIGENLYR